MRQVPLCFSYCGSCIRSVVAASKSRAFDCAERASDTQDYRDDGFDAVVTIHATAEGTFSSPARASGRQEATVSCTGSQCNSLGAGALPCNFTVDFIIQAF